MKRWKKRLVSASVMVLSVLIICDIAYAVGTNGYDYSAAMTDGGWTSTTTGIRYNSYGRINYSDGNNSVVIDTADIAAIDDMVGNGKKEIRDAIKSIDQDDRMETSTWSDTFFPSFYELANLTGSSQTVPKKQKQEQAVNYKSELIYYRDADAAESGNLGRTTAENSGLIVTCKEAVADNLSAGAVAFVDGCIIIGNGADNAEYYKQGYIDGMNKDKDYKIIYTYHHHVDGNGNAVNQTTSSVSGGCFNDGIHEHDDSCSYKMVHKHTNDCIKYCDCSSADDPLVGTGSGLCKCGHPQHGTSRCGVNVGYKCNNSPTNKKSYTCDNLPCNVWQLSCGKSEGQIESATITFLDSDQDEEAGD